MFEDKLSREERIRLEALAQANSFGVKLSDADILKRAVRFEKYIVRGVVSNAE